MQPPFSIGVFSAELKHQVTKESLDDPVDLQELTRRNSLSCYLIQVSIRTGETREFANEPIDVI